MEFGFLTIFHPVIKNWRDGISIFHDFRFNNLASKGWNFDFSLNNQKWEGWDFDFSVFSVE
jgi:hypothetical protein